MKTILGVVVILSLFLSACAPEEPTQESPPVEDESEQVLPPQEEEDFAEEEAEFSPTYGVSAGHPDAVDAGMTVLENGGNAVDAAIAAAYAVSVVEPFASGIGGGGVTLIQAQGEEAEAYDYREVVPENGIPASDIGVPGFVAGLMLLHEDYGTANWEDLLTPAINLAHSSEVSQTLEDQLQSAQNRLPVQELGHFYPDGSPIEAGSTLQQVELAETLERIRASEGTSFYQGALSEDLIEIEGLDATSLANFEIGRHEPVAGEFEGYEIIGAPAPLPSANVIQMLQIVEARGILEKERNSTAYIHDIAMAWRLARQFVETDLGDPSFVEVPVGEITDPENNAALAEEISSDELVSEEASLSYVEGDPNTTHITVVDEDGMVVSMTNTLTNFFGSTEYTNGFFLNNQMSRFETGETAQNTPEPGRRSVTWSSPILIADEEGPLMGIGSPGGIQIPIMLTQIITDWAQGEETFEEIIYAPRFQLEDTTLIVEEPISQEQENELLEIGYSEVSEPPSPLYFGSMQALYIDRETEEIIGAADPRREGDFEIEGVE